VETFDLRRRSCLHLTYYAHGDTRNRGAALLVFSNAYRRAGFVLTEDELPDHLCVVLEFAPRSTPTVGRVCCTATGPVWNCCIWRCATKTPPTSVLSRQWTPPCPHRTTASTTRWPDSSPKGHRARRSDS